MQPECNSRCGATVERLYKDYLMERGAASTSCMERAHIHRILIVWLEHVLVRYRETEPAGRKRRSKTDHVAALPCRQLQKLRSADFTSCPDMDHSGSGARVEPQFPTGCLFDV